MPTRGGLVGSTVVLVIVTIAIAGFVVSRGPKANGPIATGFHESWVDHFSAPAGETWTWGIILPENTTNQSIVIEAVEFVDVANVRVGQVLADDPLQTGGLGLVPGFPPPGHTGVPPAGYSVAANGAAGAVLQFLVPVARTGAGDGTIGGVHVRYRSQGVLYEDSLPVALRIDDPVDATP